MDEDSELKRRLQLRLKLEAIRAKHPLEPDSVVFPSKESLVPPVGPVTSEEVINAVISFPNGSAGGPDGLRPQHLKDMLKGVRDPASTELAESLALLITLMLEGKVPDDICPVLYGASLTALPKKDGGIRPIAVGNTLRRLAGKIVSKQVMETMGVLVRPQQLGYGTKGGAEAAFHATRVFISHDKA
ncbi:hypothetical protein RvY_14911 [Ramazzottius varieornatus]|uniref:Reverse transcriptase domain-containing protein n=1 Tax=Ramazzottius varieornatus TaxID=947166 RepID=A0A1D1VSX9_RAMVA|nr:hypothetical protein RvY_14911 [Ramazzottius varieornatus]